MINKRHTQYMRQQIYNKDSIILADIDEDIAYLKITKQRL